MEVFVYTSGDAYLSMAAKNASIGAIVRAAYVGVHGDVPPEHVLLYMQSLSIAGEHRDVRLKRVPANEVFGALSESLGVPLDLLRLAHHGDGPVDR